MVIDLRRCAGCQTCTIACKQEHSLPPGIFWRYVVDLEVGKYPDVRRSFLPMGCMHCGDPPCVPVCPTGASKKREDGVVWIQHDLCVGCGYCAVACPYQARHLIEDEQSYFLAPTPSETKTRDPERHGVMTKCTFCMHRLDKASGEGRPGIDPEFSPVCSTSCIANAIQFGDLNNRDSVVCRLLKDHKAERLLEELGTDPSVYYITSDR